MSEKTETSLKFKCPSCGDTRLEEVCTDVVQSSICTCISEEGIDEYGETSYDGGVLDRYQCLNCGYVINDDKGNKIECEEELVEWLKQNCFQGEK